MSKKSDLMILFCCVLFTLIVVGCSPAGGEDPGHEFMPDMFHSTAYEANINDYYYYNTWGTEQEYLQYAMPRKPVKGTIPHGFALLNDDNEEFFAAMPVNGHVPYYYDDTEEERTRASAEITTNPFPYTAESAVRGKELYDIYCGICHGEKGDGGGYLVREDGGVYPAQPANFLQEEFYNASEGRLYHSIMYGKNVMGGYSDKLSFEERWQVIHHIRSLQAAEQGVAYAPKLPDEDVSMATDTEEKMDESEASSTDGGH